VVNVTVLCYGSVSLHEPQANSNTEDLICGPVEQPRHKPRQADFHKDHKDKNIPIR